MLFLHLGDLIEERGVEQGELSLNIREKVNNAFALDALFQEFSYTLIDFLLGDLHLDILDPVDGCPDGFEESSLITLLFVEKTTAKADSIFQKEGFLKEGVALLLHRGGEHEVDSAFDDLSSVSVCSVVESGIVELVEEVTADFKLFLELEKCRFLDIWIAVVLLVLLGVITHGLFESLCNADIVNHQSTGFT